MRKENGVYIFTEQEYQEMLKNQQETEKACAILIAQLEALQNGLSCKPKTEKPRLALVKGQQ